MIRQLNEISKDAEKLRLEMSRTLERIGNNETEIDEMQGEQSVMEDNLNELEQEMEELETAALEDGFEINVYFDDLVRNLVFLGEYGIERDPWVIKERYGVEGAQFLVTIRRTGSVYAGLDSYPTPDSYLWLVAQNVPPEEGDEECN